MDLSALEIARRADRGRPSRAVRLTLHAAMVATSLIPALFGYWLFMTDIPNAVARIAINLRLIADPASSQFYTFRPVPVPNMAFDTWGLVLGPWVGPETAATLLMAVAVILLYAAVQWLRLGMVGRTSLLMGAVSLFFIQSGVFRWGLINYEIGSALSLFAIGLANRHFADPRALLSPGALASRSALCLASVLCSVFPSALYTAYVAGRLPGRLRGQSRGEAVRQVVDAGLPLVLPALFLLCANAKLPEGPDDTVWTLSGKISGLVALFYVRAPALELALAVAFVASFVLLGVYCRFTIAPLQRLPILAMAAMIMVLPSRLVGVDAVDYRLVQMLALLLCGMVEVRRRDYREWGGSIRLVVAVLIAMSLVRPFVAIRSLEPVAALKRNIDDVFAAVPDGARLAVVTDLPDFRYVGHRIWHLPLLSMAASGKDVRVPVFLNFFTHRREKLGAEEPWLDLDSPELGPALCNASHVLAIGSPAVAERVGTPVLRRNGLVSLMVGPACPSVRGDLRGTIHARG
ncbi:MAG: hypothetical protein U1E62_03445 [Alsobacter sp.]